RTRGTIDAPIGRHGITREKMSVARRPDAREAVTHYEVERSFGTPPVASLIRCRLETGRTHQIRVHMAHLGHPLLGDETYGKGFKTKATQLPEPAQAELVRLGRQALHAYHLTLEHPVSGEILEFETEWPEDLTLLRAALTG